MEAAAAPAMSGASFNWLAIIEEITTSAELVCSSCIVIAPLPYCLAMDALFRCEVERNYEQSFGEDSPSASIK